MFKKLLFLTLLLISQTNVYCVTEFTSALNKTGEDYGSFSTWEAAMDDATDLTDGQTLTGNWDAQAGTIADAATVTWDSGVNSGVLIHMTDAGASGTYLVRGDTLAEAQALGDDDVIDDGGGNTITVAGSPDSAIIRADVFDDDGAINAVNFTIDGLTTDATNFMKITAAVEDRHTGTEGTGTIVDNSGTGSMFLSLDAFLEISWLEVTDQPGTCFSMGGGNETVHHIVGYDMGTVATGNTYNMHNSIFYIVGDGIRGNGGATADVVIRNVTILRALADGDTAVTGIRFVKSINCISMHWGPTGGHADYLNRGAGSSNSMAHDTSGDIDSKVAADQFANLTGGSEDLHLKSGADAIDAGTDLGAVGGARRRIWIQ